ncbi:MAG: Haloacid dehalogenase domain protein hydrolase [Solirubrobacteraceae bacterium]|nr:Haloacid dehalogenase domain protein hydrolase [Solirubrobacteraceae bacterium]
MHAALRDVYGLTDPGAVRVPAAGRTDIEIARNIALLCDLPSAVFDDGLDDLQVAVAEHYALLVPDDLSDRVAPGVPELLEALAARDDVLLSLVTGNLETVARMKLRAAGIGGWFAAGQGGFGSDHEDRTELPAIARRRAGANGAPHPREDTIVVGDTPRDIACARADGVRCVAVAGGPYDAGELADADAVAPDARSLLGAIDSLP